MTYQRSKTYAPNKSWSNQLSCVPKSVEECVSGLKDVARLPFSPSGLSLSLVYDFRIFFVHNIFCLVCMSLGVCHFVYCVYVCVPQCVLLLLPFVSCSETGVPSIFRDLPNYTLIAFDSMRINSIIQPLYYIFLYCEDPYIAETSPY